MLRTLFAALFLAGAALALTAARADDKKADDPKALDGEYTFAAGVKGGKEAPPEVLKSIQSITIKDGVMTIKVKAGDKEDTKTAKLKTDASKKPAEMEFSPQDGPEKGKSYKGIYSQDKGELKLAWVDSDTDAPRPKDFTSTAENKVMVLTLKKK